jgi:hypothetical protein
MEIKKFNLDRKPLTEEQIKAKQNFRKILEGSNFNKPGIWKSPWFYGAIGLSSFATFILLSTDFETKKEFNAETTTLPQKPSQIVKSSAFNHIEPSLAINKSSDSKESISNIATNVVSQAMNYQVESETRKQETVLPQLKKVQGLPSIGGVANGIIKSSILLNAEIIESGFDFDVNGYKVNYYDGYKEVEERLKGNALPIELREKLLNFNLGEIVFFTEIHGLDNLGINHDLPSMSLRISKN